MDKKPKFKIGDKVFPIDKCRSDFSVSNCEYGIVSRIDDIDLPEKFWYRLELINSQTNYDMCWTDDNGAELEEIVNSPLYKLLQEEK